MKRNASRRSEFVPIIKKLAKARPALEIDIQTEAKNAINALPDARVERNNKWSGWVVRDDGSRHWVEAGLPDGSADLVGRVRIMVTFADGVKRTIARAFYLEFKRPLEKQRKSQVDWETQVKYMCAFYAVVHSVDEALAAVERCRRGELS